MSHLPPQAKRVFKGIIFDVYQWQQQMFDGSSQTFEMVKRPHTVVVLPLAEGKVFYSYQEQPGKKPFFGLFGGRVEEGEEPLAAAKRELLEESGLVSEKWENYFTHEIQGKVDWTIHYFIARECRQTQGQTLDAGEKIEIKSCPAEEFVETVLLRPDFVEVELRNKVLSAFNPAAAAQVKEMLS